MKYLSALLLSLVFISFIQAQPGTLDKTYGEAGLAYYDHTQTVNQTSAVQADGKTIVGGAIYISPNSVYRLLRFCTDGSLDTSFGNKGFADAVFSGYLGSLYGWTSVQVQPDGKIVAAGYILTYNYDNYPPYDADIVLARFNQDGTPDVSFGNNGTVITDFGEYESVNAMILQPDGKIVITGIYSEYGTGYDTYVLLVRYNQDGSLDNSFGNNRHVVYEGTGADMAYALALQQDGKLVVAGNWAVNDKCMVLRFMPDGNMDSSFGSNGQVLTQIGGTADQVQTYFAVTIDKEQRIIAAGRSNEGIMAVARYNTYGSPDNSFADKGKKVILNSTNQPLGNAKSVLLLKDERILLGGDTNGDISLACLQPSGAFDSTFDTNGVTITNLGGDEIFKNAVVQSDGKIVVLGSNGTPFLARYNGYPTDKQSPIVRIRRWLQHHGISWQAVQSSSAVRCYTIQRSYDGILYKDVAKVSPKVNTYEEAAPLTTVNSYYRIAATNWDGRRTYSNTVLVDDGQAARIYPNPVSATLHLQNLPLTGNTNLSIVDLYGNVRSTATTTGSNYSVNTANLSSGSYLLKIQHNGTATTLPFVKE